MEQQKLCCLFLVLLFNIQFSSSAFTPDDNYLINCGGSTVNTTMDGTRTFIGDLTNEGAVFLSDTQTETVSDQNTSSRSSLLYQTARVFTQELSYEFEIKKKGLHMVRLHFFPFSAQSYNLSSARFHVSVNGVPIVRDFTSVRNSTSSTVVPKEYFVRVSMEKAVIMFTPVTGSRSGFGFVNAIEVFSIPDNLIVMEGIRLVGSNGIVEYKGSSSLVFETVHRINAGGSKITPSNDTLWRTWIPDENYLVFKPAARAVSRSTPPNYQDGGASREIAPDHVYMTAQEMNRDNTSTAINFNITWDLPLSPNAGRTTYLVRMHFCDIVSTSLNQLLFDVYINGYSAYEGVDLSRLSVQRLASPYYLDFVVNSENFNSMRVSVGPSDLSSPSRVNAILNGLEIMKMVYGDESSEESGLKKKNFGVLVGPVAGGFVLLSIVIALIIRYRKKKPKKEEADTFGLGGLRISFADIQSATNNFNEKAIIGEGGFGKVYQGALKDGREVAVKRGQLGPPGISQGRPEFHSEITVSSRIRHQHLVSLVGFCEEQSEMILVYEFVKNGTLRSHLYGSDQSSLLSWEQRLEICIGAARGLHYLHTGLAEGGIIHRDIKSTNILLDENYVAKVADFGLCRSGPTLDKSHVSTIVKGTFGYLDPEYFRNKQLTDKSDVYSFGVLLIEVLCARQVLDPLLLKEEHMNLAEWAIQMKNDGKLEQVMDQRLVGEIKLDSLRLFGDIAEKCLAKYGEDRPKMGDVLWNLENALKLQKTGGAKEVHKDSTVYCVSELPVAAYIPHEASAKAKVVEDDSFEYPSMSMVTSELVKKEGR
ncbi:hypothetical protein ACHQM5_000482 [Ranunculus cassubicifolius]